MNIFQAPKRRNTLLSALISLSALLLATVLLAGCVQPQPNESPLSPLPTPAPPASVKMQPLPVERDLAPAVDDETLAQLVASNQAFAFDLYHATAEDDANLVFSPYSVSTALSMLYAGARGETAAQMAETLHYTLPRATLHPAFNALDLRIQPQTDDEAFQLETANGLWLQKDFSFEPDYLNTLAANYDVSLWLADFKDDAHRREAVQFINDWTVQRTGGRIQSLWPPDALTEDTRLVLVNAIYFKGDWLFPFNAAYTQDLPFTRVDGEAIQTPMMSKRLDVPYAAGDGYQAVALPYVGEQVRMVAILPDAERFSEVEAQLSPDFVQAVEEQLATEDINILFPKFEFDSKFDLVETLSAMGMPDLFTRYVADLTGMSKTGGLFVKEGIHQAFIAVDEKGTEAAAATGFSAEPSSMPLTVEFNRPFFYLIQDVETGEILFLGRVMDPSQ